MTATAERSTQTGARHRDAVLTIDTLHTVSTNAIPVELIRAECHLCSWHSPAFVPRARRRVAADGYAHAEQVHGLTRR